MTTSLRDRPEVDPRLAERRRSVELDRRARFRRRAGVVAGVATVVAGLWWAARSPALDVDRVEVTGAVRTDPATVLEAAGIDPGDALVDLDVGAAERAVAVLPWVATAEVRRDWWGDVTLAISERTPAAAVVGPTGGVHLVDADGRVLAAVAHVPDGLLPLYDVGEAAPGASLGDGLAQSGIAVARALTPGVATRVSAVQAGDPGDVVLVLRPSGVVRLGPATALAEKVRSLQAVFSQVDLQCLAAVDVSVPDTPVLTRDAACG